MQSKIWSFSQGTAVDKTVLSENEILFHEIKDDGIHACFK